MFVSFSFASPKCAWEVRIREGRYMTYQGQTGSTSSTTLYDVSRADRKHFVNDVTRRIKGRQEALRQRRYMTYHKQTGKTLSTTLHDVSGADRKHFIQRRYKTYQGQTGSTSSTTLQDVSRADRKNFVNDVTWRIRGRQELLFFVNDVTWRITGRQEALRQRRHCYTIQLYCLRVEKFVFWFVICIKHSIHFTIKHSTIQ